MIFQQIQRKPILKLNQLMIFLPGKADLNQYFHPFSPSINVSFELERLGIMFQIPNNCHTQVASVHPAVQLEMTSAQWESELVVGGHENEHFI